MIKKFDIDFVASYFHATNLKFYLVELLRGASKPALRHLRQKVRTHKKHNRQNQAFSDVPNLSTHDAIIAAISHELLKRSFVYWLYKAIFPIRKFLVSTFTEKELKEHEVFGSLYPLPKCPKGGLRTPITEIIRVFGCFLMRNSKFIITTIVSIIGLILSAMLIYLTWLQLIKTR